MLLEDSSEAVDGSGGGTPVSMDTDGTYEEYEVSVSVLVTVSIDMARECDSLVSGDVDEAHDVVGLVAVTGDPSVSLVEENVLLDDAPALKDPDGTIETEIVSVRVAVDIVDAMLDPLA